MSVCWRSGTLSVSFFASGRSNRHSSTLVACAEKIAKLTPTPVQLAPSGYGSPGHTRIAVGGASRVVPVGLPRRTRRSNPTLLPSALLAQGRPEQRRGTTLLTALPRATSTDDG